MLKSNFRFLLIPLGAIATIVALSQSATHATTRWPVANATEQLVDCTQENRNTVDVCIIADSLSR